MNGLPAIGQLVYVDTDQPRPGRVVGWGTIDNRHRYEGDAADVIAVALVDLAETNAHGTERAGIIAAHPDNIRRRCQTCGGVIEPDHVRHVYDIPGVTDHGPAVLA